MAMYGGSLDPPSLRRSRGVNASSKDIKLKTDATVAPGKEPAVAPGQAKARIFLKG
jgi:hypothetical protein